MAKYTFLLLLLLTTMVTFAQQKKKPHQRRFIPPVIITQPVINTGKPAPKASPGSIMTFPDLLLLLDPKSAPDDLLAQKKFIGQNNILESDYKADTFRFRNSLGESLVFYYSPSFMNFAPWFLFQTTSASRAAELIRDALKNGFTATDSTIAVAGDGEENYLIHPVRYSEAVFPQTPERYETPPPPGQKIAYRNSFTNYEERTPSGSLYSFYFLRQEQYDNMTGVKTNVVAPEDGYPDDMYGPSSAPAADIIKIQPGKPTLIFVDIDFSAGKNKPGEDPDSLRFFGQVNDFYNSSAMNKVRKLYPASIYRYVNIYKPCVVQINNDGKETLYFDKPGKFYSEFAYWSGENKDRVVRHNSWREAAYVVANARGDNKLMAGYAGFLEDSIAVRRLLQEPEYKPSAELLQQMNYFILSVLWKDIYLPLPLMQPAGTKSILMTGKQHSVQYHFNRNGLLDSVRSQALSSFSWNTITIVHKEGVPAAVYDRYDTAHLSYAADTLIVLKRNHLYRYKLTGKLLLQIDDFDFGSDDYFRNDIRDGYYKAELQGEAACVSKFRDLEMTSLKYSECYSNAAWQLPLSVYNPYERQFRDKDGSILSKKSFEKDTAGNLLIIEGKGRSMEKRSTYIFRNNRLLQLRITNGDLSENDLYHVYITQYD